MNGSPAETDPTTDTQEAGLTGHDVLRGLIYAPGRVTLAVFVLVSYLWLAVYMGSTVAGIRADPIASGDWMTLLFTAYALFFALALAHRILRIGLSELTNEYLIDVVGLTWLTAFYFVWMLAREPVAPTTSVDDLSGPVFAGDPSAIVAASIVGVTALAVARVIARPRSDTPLFQSSFRAAAVTFPGVLTAIIVVLQPASHSLLWLGIGGVFVGTIVGGLLHIQSIVVWTVKGLFAVCTLGVWAVGAVIWVFTHWSRPPNHHIVFSQVGVSPTTADTDDEMDVDTDTPLLAADIESPIAWVCGEDIITTDAENTDKTGE